MNLSPPADLVRLQALLSDHDAMDPVVDTDRLTLEVWVVEEGGELCRWILVGIGERTVTVMNPHDRRDRYVRQHRHVWVQPDIIPFRARGPKGYRLTGKVTWTLQQGETGRRNAREARLARQAAELEEAL